ncbi:glutathione S-transferase family protein [Marinobacter caseinilyticus]|uniref:glutathione S-transferase family protein n=1 Tax=Marinobacter caseinilyticus TaxID=2692195 RepID=UPI00140BB646|nr:glutathione S-transferase [Marinobacter caseinilyticus]
MSDVQLYQFAISHFCEKVRWALDFKGIDYEAINLLPGTHVKTVRQLTGKSSVPVLVHQGQAIQGSANIINYLDDTFPEHSLTPEDPAQRDAALAWEKRLDEEAGPAIRCYCYHYLLQRPKLVVPMLTAQKSLVYYWLIRLGFSKLEDGMRNYMKINVKTASQSQVAMEKILAELAAAYAQSEYLVGDRFSRADLAAAALFSALFQPKQYPVPWPALNKVPTEMRQWIEQQAAQLAPLAKLYARYR